MNAQPLPLRLSRPCLPPGQLHWRMMPGGSPWRLQAHCLHPTSTQGKKLLLPEVLPDLVRGVITGAKAKGCTDRSEQSHVQSLTGGPGTWEKGLRWRFKKGGVGGQLGYIAFALLWRRASRCPTVNLCFLLCRRGSISSWRWLLWRSNKIIYIKCPGRSPQTPFSAFVSLFSFPLSCCHLKTVRGSPSVLLSVLGRAELKRLGLGVRGGSAAGPHWFFPPS